MKQFYSLVVLLFAILTSGAQSLPPQPLAPVSCNGSSCITNSNIDVCPPGSNFVVSRHRNGVYNRGNSSNNLGPGAVWRFRNFAVVDGVTVNCEIRIDEVVQASIVSFDNDAAVDQTGSSLADLFAPEIRPDVNLNGTDRNGYVQFTMSFYKNSTGTNNNTSSDFATAVSLSNINYVHYDIDGNDAGNVSRGTPGSWFRETGAAKRITNANPIVMANYPSELTVYNYSDAISSTDWAGFAGTVCDRDGVSKCAQIASSFSYNGAYPSITFRMGYDYNAGGNVGRPTRQYGSRLGCFNFPAQVTLPVKLTSFSGSYSNNNTVLNWESASELDFDHYEIERSADNSSYVLAGSVASKGSFGGKYQFIDNLAAYSENVFFYRLKMVDIDGNYKYSNIIMIRKESGSIKDITISPNPVVTGSMATIRLQADTKKNAEIRILDASGRMVARQQNQLSVGTNSISLNNLNNIQSGIYTVQVIADGEVKSTRLSVIR